MCTRKDGQKSHSAASWSRHLSGVGDKWERAATGEAQGVMEVHVLDTHLREGFLEGAGAKPSHKGWGGGGEGEVEVGKRKGQGQGPDGRESGAWLKLQVLSLEWEWAGVGEEAVGLRGGLC